MGTISVKERDGKRGRVTINRDGSILLENVIITDVKFKNCDIFGQSGECPISFADRMNNFENYMTLDNYPLGVGGRNDEQYPKDEDAAYGQYQQERATKFEVSNG